MTLGLDAAVGDGPQGPEVPAGGVPGELPVGWVRATLLELGVEAQPGFASGKHNRDGEGVVHLRPMNITRNGAIDLSDARYVNDDSDRRVECGDVLFNNTNSPALVGKTAWVGSPEPAAYSNHMTRLRGPKGLDSKFLALQLHWLWASGYFKTILNNHVNQASVARKALLATKIVVPPLSEQLRIVAEVERQVAHISLGELAVDRARGGISRLKSAILEKSLIDAASSGRLLRDLISAPLANGKSVPTRDGGFPVLKLNSIRGGLVDPSIQKGGDWGTVDPKKYLIAEGDFLVARGNGTLSLVGRGALVPEVRSPVAYPDTLIRVRVDTEKLSPVYLGLVWNCRSVREQIERQARTTAGIYKVNQAILENVEIPYVSLGDQERLVEKVYQAYATFDPLVDEVGKIRSSSSHLRAALLRSAFTGTLVPQNPADEPASVLLDRIRAGRKAKVPRKSTARKPRPAPSGQEELPS